MALSTGEKIGPYEILSPLGAGGMGEVYRARDPKLQRDVAIKVLPAALAQDLDRLARFEREARTLASLNHPNIAAIYGVEQGALIMELVEGEMLKGPKPLDEALDIARQIADGLEAAHEKGIIHRDLKPANIKITPEGIVKILDFGLAKAMETAPQSSDPETSPTLTQHASVSGVIMGTAGYMSPEQARGAKVDRRTDIWAFGVVLYELLTAQRAFPGETISDTLAAVLTKDIDLNQVPARVQPLLRRCLEREPKKRLGWVGEARYLLDARPGPPSAKASKLPWIAAAVCTLVAAGAGFALFRAPKPTAVAERRFTITPPGLTLSPENISAVISPDGRKIAYIATNQLWIRELDHDEPRPVEGTEGATVPFWSPDSQLVGIVVSDRLWKVAIAGGRPVEVARVGNVIRGAVWELDGRNILVSGGLGLTRISAAGGSVSPLFLTVDSGRSYYNLKAIPRTRLLLSSTIRVPRLLLLDLETNTMEELGIAGHSPVYSPTGHILYTVPSETTGADVWALPFSIQTRKATGPPFPAIRGAGLPSVAADGTVVCTDAVLNRIVLRGRDGKATGTLASAQPLMSEFAVSADGKRAAVAAVADSTQSIWIHDIASGIKKRLTSGSAYEYSPKWSPDGKSVAYTEDNRGEYRVLIIEVASGASTVVQPPTKERTILDEWSADGQYIFFTRGSGQSRLAGYYRKRPDGPGYEAVTLLKENARYPRLSPNRRFYLHSSSEYFVNVKPFPEGPESWQVSLDSGVYWPRWGGDGREIFFVWNGALMAVEVSTQSVFSNGRPRTLFRVPGAAGASVSAARFEIMPDGSFAFIEAEPSQSGHPASIHIVENWLPGSVGNIE